MTSALLAELQSRVGTTFQSEWLLIDQAMIDRFAEATGDFRYRVILIYRSKSCAQILYSSRGTRGASAPRNKFKKE
jgi:hypothetical protein